MTCDGRHVKTLLEILGRLDTAFVARRQEQTNPNAAPGPTKATIMRLESERAEAKQMISLCSECLADWAELSQ